MSSAVAAITLEYRGPSRTTACVRSLLVDGVRRVIVFDNSADEGFSAAKLHEAFDSDPRVRIVEQGENLGFAAGVNAALAILREEGWDERVLLVNNDASLFPGAIEALNQALDGHADAALAYPTVVHAGKMLANTFYHPVTGRISTGEALGGMRYASGCCVLLAREETRTDLLDETFFMYGEDVELCARLRRRNRRFVHVPDALVEHEGSAGSGSNTLFYETHVVAAHVILAARLADSPSSRMLYGVGRFAFLPLRALLRAVRYRSLVPFVGLTAGWRLGRAALRIRSEGMPSART